MAVVAKNWALGSGWASSRYGWEIFDSQITTGPAVLGVVALGVRWLGQAFWVPGLTVVLLNLVLLVAVATMLHGILSPAVYRRALCLLCLMYTVFDPVSWIAPLGDVPAALYFMLAALLVHVGLERAWIPAAFLGGVLGGLAVLSKTVAVLPVLGLVLLPLLYRLQARRDNRNAVCIVLGFTVGLAVAILPWWGYRYYALSGLSPEWQFLQAEKSRHLLVQYGSGIAGLRDAGWGLPRYLVSTAWHNLTAYGALMPIWLWGPWGLPLMVLAVLAGLLLGVRRFSSPLWRLQMALLVPSTLYLVWLLAVGQVNGRYLLMAVLPVCLALSVWAAQWRGLTFALAAWWLFVAMIVSPGDWQHGRFYRWPGIPDVQASGLLAVRNELERHHADATWVSCSGIASHDVDFVLSETGRLTDCQYRLGQVLEFDADAFRGKYPQWEAESDEALLRRFIGHGPMSAVSGLVAPVRWRADIDFIVIENAVSRSLPDWGYGPLYGQITAFCDDAFYDNGEYALRHCSASALRRAVDAAGGLWFVPPQWDAEARLQRARAEGLLP